MTTAERQKLARAIEVQRQAQQALDEAQLAHANAEARWSACAAKSGAIARAIEAAETGKTEDSTDGMIAALASGADLAVLDKEKSSLDELRDNLVKADEETARWRRAVKVAETAVGDRKEALNLAASYTDGHARKVIADEVEIDAMMRDCESARAVVLDLQAKMAAIAGVMDHFSEKRRTIANAIDGFDWIRDSQTWRKRPAGEPIRAMFEALKSDSAAELRF
ncbi:MAG TPA: hypothetical protein VIF88_02080 [Methylocystis sp.]|jgi:chromosome segregation ATPase